MRELVAVIIISCTISTLPLQIVGFITPFWACGEIQHTGDNYTTTTTTTTQSSSMIDDYHTTTETTQSSPTKNVSCNLNGMFYTCAESGCHASVLDSSLLGLCLTSLIVTCGTAVYMIKVFGDQMKKNGLIEWTFDFNIETTMFVLFVIGQILAGVAAIIMFTKYQVMGWSAVLFTTLALPIVIIAIIIVSIVVSIWLCVSCCNDDDD